MHREGNVKMEAGIRVMWPQTRNTKDSWHTPETQRGKGWILSQRLRREYGREDLGFQTSGLQNCSSVALSHQVYGNLVQQPQKINTLSII